jgi:cytochrome c heme-lyase
MLPYTYCQGGTDTASTWTYPSPQMFYNALARKGKLADTDEDDIANVVAMHNNMNERTWSKVVEWERVVNPSALTHPKLLKFMGRPTDLSPKAAFKHYLLGHPLPYDRHDWTLLRDDGSVARYVIDYYYDETRASDTAASAFPDLNDESATPSLLVDVRPALDGPVPAWNRVVTMPYARRVAKSTAFEPCPMMPSAGMKSQVKESVQVWAGIQQQAASKTTQSTSAAEMTDERAQKLARDFAKGIGDCRKARQRMDECDSEVECAKASMDLTTCMGRILCPLQYQTLVGELDKLKSDDDTITSALERITECVALKNGEHATAKKLYPHMFTKS